MAIPTEHGGWSLTAEPIVLGLVVGWSPAGAALGLAAMLAFVARTPLKVVLVDRWRGRTLDRTQVAARIATAELVAIAALGLAAFSWSLDPRFWVPLAVAAPLVGVELWFDMRSRSRRLVPELAGTVGMGSVVTAIVLAGDGSASLALGLWAVVSARAAAAIPYARNQVLRAHGRPITRWHSDLAQALAAAAVLMAWLLGAVPLGALVAVAGAALLNLGWSRGPVRPAKVVGMQQLFLGVAVVVVTAVAVLG